MFSMGRVIESFVFIDHYDSFSFNVIDLLERVGGISIVHCYFDKIEKNIF